VSACNDLIEFDSSEDWERVIAITKTATRPTPDSHVPIPAFDLGVRTDASHFAIVVQAIDPKPTWLYGGEIRQNWNFPSGASIGTGFALAESKPTQLRLNRVQAIPLARQSTSTYRLRYTPPTWFTGVIVIGWKYVGTVENFTKDTLFEIGNKVGTGTLDEPDNLSNLLIAQQALLENIILRLDAIESTDTNVSSRASFSTEQARELNEIVTQIASQTNNKIDTLTSNLSTVLGNENNSEFERETTNETSLEEEFL